MVSRLWTPRYPTQATLPMAAAVKVARHTPVDRIAVPALFIISDSDQVVDAAATRQMAGKWPRPSEIIAIEKSGDPSNHVNAGDARSPETTEPTAAQILQWLETIGIRD